MKKLICAIPTGWCTAIMLAVVTYLSLASNPVDSSFNLFADADKMVHTLMYFFLAVAFYFDYTKYTFPHHSKSGRELVIMASVILYGIIMEACQIGIEERSFEVSDICANALGVLAAFILYEHRMRTNLREVLKHRRHRHHHHHHHHKSERPAD